MTRVLFWDAKEAGAAIADYRIVKYGNADGKVIQAAAAGDHVIGVAGRGAASGARIEVARIGVAEVEYGGAVTRGDRLKSDADGKAIPSTAATDAIIGIAEVSGVDGDIGQALLTPGEA